MSRLFAIYGEWCATHPWEIIIAVITITTSFFTLDKQPLELEKKPVVCKTCLDEHFNAADVVVMTVIRCIAILYSYHQFKNLQNLGSKYIMVIAGFFIVFSSFVFTSAALKLLQIELIDLKDALFFFLLLTDLSKAAKLTQFALTSSSQVYISKNIARGVSILGPQITLDTIVETLVISVGTLSGVNRLEMLSYFACMTVIVNYIIFMTVFPAFLSLILELGRVSNFYGEESTGVMKMLLEENEKSNPVVQRVKMIMSLGLVVVHINSRWRFSDTDTSGTLHIDTNKNCTEDASFYVRVMKQFALSADHIVILILLITLIVKFTFFENREFLQEFSENDTAEDSHLTLRGSKRTISFSVEIQTDEIGNIEEEPETSENLAESRTLPECLKLFRADEANKLFDDEIIKLVETKHVPSYNLERVVKNPERGVLIRRKVLEKSLRDGTVLKNLPYQNYNYSKVMGACAENVIGYCPVPVGFAGPLLLDGVKYFVPMATTEGCLIASTNRGCRAVEKVGVTSCLVADGMTRGPIIRFPSVEMAAKALHWVKRTSNFAVLKTAFDSTSRFARLQRVSTHIAGRNLFVRFVAETGDAMGMNMISKGTERALDEMRMHFPSMEVLSLSGNVCTDKKPSAINWIEGRGKSVTCECIIPEEIVKTVLKTTTRAMVDLNISKNMIGSAVAGSIGGFNAHAANIVTAIFIATGQDAAQNVCSSNCFTILETWGESGEDLYVSCTMPSVEVGTIGGGTILPAQSACLDMLGLRGAHESSPGQNAKQLARIVCGTVLVGELSLLAALAAGHLVRSHMKMNRSFSDAKTIVPVCDSG